MTFSFFFFLLWPRALGVHGGRGKTSRETHSTSVGSRTEFTCILRNSDWRKRIESNKKKKKKMFSSRTFFLRSLGGRPRGIRADAKSRCYRRGLVGGTCRILRLNKRRDEYYARPAQKITFIGGGGGGGKLKKKCFFHPHRCGQSIRSAVCRLDVVGLTDFHRTADNQISINRFYRNFTINDIVILTVQDPLLQ